MTDDPTDGDSREARVDEAIAAIEIARDAGGEALVALDRAQFVAEGEVWVAAGGGGPGDAGRLLGYQPDRLGMQ
jgi:hypothetical protein